MTLSVYPQRTYGQVVTPVTPVRPAVERAPERVFERNLTLISDPPPPSDVMRKARADALAELAESGEQTASEFNATRFRGLDRDQLAGMAFDRSGSYSVDIRRGALKQLQSNDRVFLDRARELAEISGDDRVRLNAELELEQSKGAIERAVPKGEEGPSPSLLRRQVAEKTTELGGAPVGISLRYPNGWTAEEKSLSLPDSLGVNNISPGATRVALMYRESLF